MTPLQGLYYLDNAVFTKLTGGSLA